MRGDSLELIEQNLLILTNGGPISHKSRELLGDEYFKEDGAISSQGQQSRCVLIQGLLHIIGCSRMVNTMITISYAARRRLVRGSPRSPAELATHSGRVEHKRCRRGRC